MINEIYRAVIFGVLVSVLMLYALATRDAINIQNLQNRVSAIETAK